MVQVDAGYVRCYDLNTLNVRDLKAVLPKVGLHKARAIVRYRQKQGQFSSLYELAAVPGFSEHYIERYLQRLVALFCL